VDDVEAERDQQRQQERVRARDGVERDEAARR
jgi:hypothetical protein